ncbi:sugar phosphate isomerase/epimerase [Gordonia jinhuaensis]|uniref:Xylose isomerase n=1 Tax=Gordonia jinhuaensis TaxID=1517702 RepID=A0A916TG37_9ACTN|nr:TIM barrel protein [Gordonia jinhuaensis]GGB43783.1 xylose isomerase [Gordonia jinhuaensis]
MNEPRIGLAALTVLDAPPLEQLDLAERHGFDMIGIRMSPTAPGAIAYPLHRDRAALKEFRHRLADSEVVVFDVEVIKLDEDFDLADYAPLLETAAELGARAALVNGYDHDRSRMADSYAAVATACASYGLVASLEFMPWSTVPDASSAMAIVTDADGPARSILVDPIHVDRSQTTLADLTSIPRDWMTYAQICDGARPKPTDMDEITRQAHEARLPTGEGGIDLDGILSTLPEAIPVSVELPNDERRKAMGTGPWLDHLLATTKETLARR